MRLRLLLLAAVLAGFIGLGGPAGTATGGGTVRLRLQLKWEPQAQFGGYYLAQAQGFYAAEGLDVEILPGGPGIGPEAVVAAGDAELGIT